MANATIASSGRKAPRLPHDQDGQCISLQHAQAKSVGALQFHANGVTKLTVRSPEYLRSCPEGNEADWEWQNSQLDDESA